MWYILSLLPIFIITFYIYKYRDIITLYIKYLILKRPSIPESQLISPDVIKISYSFKSRIYSVYLPLHKTSYSNMNIKYHLINKGTTDVDITQQPGIEYYINSRMLGGSSIVSKKFDEIVDDYALEQIPVIKTLHD